MLWTSFWLMLVTLLAVLWIRAESRYLQARLESDLLSNLTAYLTARLKQLEKPHD